MPKKKIPVDKVVCWVCGDQRLVPLMYIDPTCGAWEGKKLVPCKKCRSDYWKAQKEKQ